jgi:cystathionine beta-lyase
MDYGNSAVENAVIQWMEKRHKWELEKEWICYSPGIVPTQNFLFKPFPNTEIQSPIYPPFMHSERNWRIVVRDPLKIINDQHEMDLDDLGGILASGVKIMLMSSSRELVTWF